MICTAGGYRLLQAERDTARIDEQLRTGRQRLQRCSALVVSRQRDAVRRQARCKLCTDLAFSDEQRRVFRIEQQVRNEHRVVTDIAAAQIRKPRDVIECRNPMMRGAELLHLLTHGGQLVGARNHRKRRQVFVDGLCGQRGAVVPHVVEKVQIGAQFDAALTQCRLQRARARQPEHCTVDCDLAARCNVFCEPVEMRGAACSANFHQLDAGTRQLPFRLRPVAAIGPYARKILGHHERSDRTGKARKPFASLPALG